MEYPKIELPGEFIINDNMIEKPLSEEDAARVKVLRGPTIVVPQTPPPLPGKLLGRVLLKCGGPA